MKRCTSAACTLLFFIITIEALGQSDSLDSSARYGKLSNGLTYYIKNVPTASQLMMQLVVKAGYIDEEPEELHLSHVLEHVVSARCADVLNNLGLKGGRDWNANTGYRSTKYWFRMPNGKNVLGEGFNILSKLLDGSEIDSVLAKNESGRVLNEIGRGESTSDFYKKNRATIFSDVHPRFIVSNKEEAFNVEHFKLKTLKKIYEQFYQPQNEAIIIVGNINVAEAESEVIKKFENLKNVSSSKIGRREYAYQPEGNQLFILFSSSGHMIKFDKYLKFRRFEITDEDDYRKSLLAQIFNLISEERTSEFNFQWRKFNPTGYYSYEHTSFNSDMGLSSIHSSLQLKKSASDQETKALLLSFLKIEQDLYKSGVSSVELTEAKETLFDRLNKTSNDPVGLEVSRYTDHFLRGSLILETHRENEIKKKLLSEITQSDINNFISSFKRDEFPVIIIEKDLEEREVFAKRSLNRIFKEANSSKSSPFVSQKARITASNEEYEQLGETPVYHVNKSLPDIQAVKCRVANGFEVIFKPIKGNVKSADKIIISAFSLVNTPFPQQPNYESILVAPRVAMEAGIGEVSGAELKYYLSKDDIQFGLGFKSTYKGMQPNFYMEVPTKKLRSGLSLMRKFILTPNFSKNAFDTTVFRNGNSFQVERSAIYDLISKYRSEDVSLSKLSLDELKLDEVKKDYNSYFSSLNGFKIIVTGDFELQETITDVMTYLGSIPSKPVSQPERQYVISPSDNSDSYCILEKNGERGSVYTYFFTNHELTIAGKCKIMVLETLLDENLFNDICGGTGLCYRAGAISERLGQNLTMLGIKVDAESKNLDTIKGLVFKVIDKLVQAKDISESLEVAKSQVLNSLESSSHTHTFWQDYFFQSYLNNESIEQFATWKTEIAKITVADIQEVARTYLLYKDLETISVSK